MTSNIEDKIVNKISVSTILSLMDEVPEISISRSVIPIYFMLKDAAEYTKLSEEVLVQLTEEGIIKYALMYQDGKAIYPMDELDKWAYKIKKNLFDIED